MQMVNTGHLVGPGHRPQSRILRCLYLLEFVSESVYVDLQYDEISLTFTAWPVCLCGVSSPVVVLGLFVRLW